MQYIQQRRLNFMSLMLKCVIAVHYEAGSFLAPEAG